MQVAAKCHPRSSNFMKLIDRMSRLGVESAFEVLVRARALEAQGKNIIHLEIGEPDFPTPPHVVEAAKKALDEGWTKYGPVQGLPELRAAIFELMTAAGYDRIFETLSSWDDWYVKRGMAAEG